LQLAEEFSQAVGVVGEIGVHLEHRLVVALERPPKARHVRGSEAQFSRAVHHVHPWVGRGELVGERAGSVRGVVVHDQNVSRKILGEDPAQELDQVLPLVVGRNDDERFHSLASGTAGAAAAGDPPWARRATVRHAPHPARSRPTSTDASEIWIPAASARGAYAKRTRWTPGERATART